MRTSLLALALAATVLPAVTPVMAQPPAQSRDDDGRPGRDRPGRGQDDRGPQGQPRGDDRGGDRGRGDDRGRYDQGRDDRGRGDQARGGPGRGEDRGFGGSDRFGGRGDQRDFRNFDYNRREPGQRGYFAERYYRTGGNYRPTRVDRNTRLYRGGNGQYYCRRNDGTTGLIVGAALGGILGNQVGYGDSRTIATLLGGTGGALLGRSIERGQLSCR